MGRSLRWCACMQYQRIKTSLYLRNYRLSSGKCVFDNESNKIIWLENDTHFLVCQCNVCNPSWHCFFLQLINIDWPFLWNPRWKEVQFLRAKFKFHSFLIAHLQKIYQSITMQAFKKKICRELHRIENLKFIEWVI